MRKVNLETVTDKLSWYKILPLNGLNLICAKKKTSQETENSLRKFLEPSEKPKVIYTDNSLEFGKACEDLSWNHRTTTPHGSETNGIAERAVRRVKEGTSAVLFQSGLDEKWWAGSLECCCYLRNVQDFLAGGKTPHERRCGEFKGPVIPFWSLVEYHPGSFTRPVKAPPNVARKFCLEYSSDMHQSRGEVGKEIFWSPTLRNWRTWTRQKSILEE